MLYVFASDEMGWDWIGLDWSGLEWIESYLRIKLRFWYHIIVPMPVSHTYEYSRKNAVARRE